MHRLLLVLVLRHPLGGPHLGHVYAAQLPVFGELVYVEVDAVTRDVGEALVHEGLDELYHLGYVIGGPGVGRAPFEAEHVHPTEERLDVAVGELVEGDPLFPGAPYGLVVYVREVDYHEDLVAPILQPAAYDVPHREGAEVSDVGVAVDRRATDIHPYLPWLNGLERSLGPR